MSKKEIFELMSQYQLEDIDVEFMNHGMVKIEGYVKSSSEDAQAIYTDLYDNLRRKLDGYSSRVYYQRDVEVLEAYADEEAELYYQQQREPKQNFHKEGHGGKRHHRDDQKRGPHKGKYDQKHYDKHHDKHHRRDHKYNKYDQHDNRHYKEEKKEEEKPTLAGFGSEGPKLFFNKKKSEMQTKASDKSDSTK